MKLDKKREEKPVFSNVALLGPVGTTILFLFYFMSSACKTNAIKPMGDYQIMNFQYNEDNETNVNVPAPNDDDNASPDYRKSTSCSNSPPTAAASPAALSLPRKKSSILGASSNLVNSIVGAGIIGIPYALRMSGLISGVALLVLVSVLTDKSLRLLIEQASFHPRLKNRNVHTFEELAR